MEENITEFEVDKEIKTKKENKEVYLIRPKDLSVSVL